MRRTPLRLAVLVGAVAAVAAVIAAAVSGGVTGTGPAGSSLGERSAQGPGSGGGPRSARADRAAGALRAASGSGRPSGEALPIVRQKLRNNCETAALSMLLVARGVHVDQLVLQRRLRRSGPLDPIPAASGGLPTWGDPDLGFVGRPEGGGTSGGFGVYEGPIRALAARYGVRLAELRGVKPKRLYARLRAGRPVLAWIGLREGPYRRWLTPSGRRITVNFGEHTVVLTGMRGNAILVNDPLTGTRLRWTTAQFEELWSRLGRRAVGI